MQTNLTFCESSLFFIINKAFMELPHMNSFTSSAQVLPLIKKHTPGKEGCHSEGLKLKEKEKKRWRRVVTFRGGHLYHWSQIKTCRNTHTNTRIINHTQQNTKDYVSHLKTCIKYIVMFMQKRKCNTHASIDKQRI